MHIAELKQHPRNTETFRDLTGEEFEDLKASISEHGIIEPVIVNQHGVIICGHQRVRACRVLGITDVPVVVREVASDEEHETLLIEENLRRRQLTVSETARAVKRLYELRGLDGVKGGPASSRENPATVAGLASELGKSERTVRTMRTLADLIPPLATMLDAGEITQAVAYQLAQLDPDGQEQMASYLGLRDLSEKEAKRIKQAFENAKKDNAAQQASIQELEARLADLQARVPSAETLEIIASLQQQLLEERAKPPKVIENIHERIIPPPDYEAVKEERLKLEVERRALKDEIAKLKAAHTQEKKKLAEKIVAQMDEELRVRQGQLATIDRIIADRKEHMTMLDKTTGALTASKKAISQIRHDLFDISMTLEDLFDDYEVPEECAAELKDLADEMLKGAQAFHEHMRGRVLVNVEAV